MGELTKQQLEVIRYGIGILKPRPHLSGSEWADMYFHLSVESSAVPGKFKTRPWQKEILDAMTDHVTPTVVLKKPTRVGFTKMINIAHAYYIDQRPCVQLHYQPNEDEAKGYAEDEFEPMVRDNVLISDLVEQHVMRGRVKKEKTVKKNYPGGYIEILGAESDRNLNRRTAKVASGDEIDTWKKEAGKAGDTIVTMMRRTSDFWDRKNILGGKPVGTAFDPELELDESVSVVDFWFQKGTQEYRYMPCPHCDHMQRFEFEDFVWDKDVDENGDTLKHYPETVRFECKSCEEEIYHKDMRWMDEHGEWRSENTEAKKTEIRSFHLWAMLSYSPNVTWADIVKEFLSAKNSRLKLKAFTNEVLARTFEEEFEKSNTSAFLDRREEYVAQVPKGALVLTMGADVQKNRIECEVIGWGANYESWAIEYRIFYGDTSQPEVWETFREFILSKTWVHENGNMMNIYTGCVDAGYLTDIVADFCKPLYRRRIFATQGASVISANKIPRTPGSTKKGKAPLFTLGVNKIKDEISWHLASEGGAGFMHFPVDDAYNAEYFKQLGAEKKMKNGKWVSTRKRNEVIDVRVYNYASLFLGGVDIGMLGARGEPVSIVHKDSVRKKKQTRKPKSHLDEF